MQHTLDFKQQTTYTFYHIDFPPIFQNLPWASSSSYRQSIHSTSLWDFNKHRVQQFFCFSIFFPQHLRFEWEISEFWILLFFMVDSRLFKLQHIYILLEFFCNKILSIYIFFLFCYWWSQHSLLFSIRFSLFF